MKVTNVEVQMLVLLQLIGFERGEAYLPRARSMERRGTCFGEHVVGQVKKQLFVMK